MDTFITSREFVKSVIDSTPPEAIKENCIPEFSAEGYQHIVDIEANCVYVASPEGKRGDFGKYPSESSALEALRKYH